MPNYHTNHITLSTEDTFQQRIESLINTGMPQDTFTKELLALESYCEAHYLVKCKFNIEYCDKTTKVQVLINGKVFTTFTVNF